jgi:predicted dehydrogenase
MRSKPIGYGIIGVGIWGEQHATLLSSEPQVNLLAVCDINEKRAKEIASRYHIPEVYTSYEEMLANKEIEAVSIATPDFAHAGPAIAAAHSGRHILVEKPLSTDLEDSIAIIKEAKQSGVTLMVDFHNRWSPPFYKSFESLQSGEIGDLKYAYFRLSDSIVVPRYFPWTRKSSVLWFLGPHSIDTARWLFQDEVKEVYAVKRKGILSSEGIDTADFYVVILHFEHGGVANLEHSWIVNQHNPSIFELKCELQASRGTVYIDTSTNRMMEMYTDDIPDGYHSSHLPDMTLSPIIHGRQLGFAPESIRHFVDCVYRGVDPIVNGLDGLRVTEIILAAEKSTELNQPVEIHRCEIK